MMMKLHKFNKRMVLIILLWTFMIFNSESEYPNQLQIQNISPSSALHDDYREIGFIGEVADDWSGYSVSGVGDVNNDSYDDIIIGAPYNDEGGVDAGQSYLILGGPPDLRSLKNSLTNADASFIGELAGDLSGYSVSGAGDVNNDSYDDIIIGAPYNDANMIDAGQSYLILGRPTNQWSMDMSLGDANASFIGEALQYQAGSSVSGAGDVNNDGYDDIIISSRFIDVGGTLADDQGQTYLILGRPTYQWNMNVSLGDANASFIGEGLGDIAGVSISGAGDVNNDGYDDIIIGAYYNDEGGASAGQSYLILGRSTTQWSMGVSLVNANASFIGEVLGDLSGNSVSGAGDVNNDGFDDILIGAKGANDFGLATGQSYILLGRPTGQWSMDMSLANANASFIGEEAFEASGCSVSGVSDVNNDGYDDIIIGAFGNDEGGTEAGKSYLILGRPTNQWSTHILPSGTNASFIGEAEGDWSGYSVSGAGDVNNDGLDDLIIGAPHNYAGGTETGQSYLILQSFVPTDTVTETSIQTETQITSVTKTVTLPEVTSTVLITPDPITSTVLITQDPITLPKEVTTVLVTQDDETTTVTSNVTVTSTKQESPLSVGPIIAAFLFVRVLNVIQTRFRRE
ncbi:MAG: integrin alpha [Candidatus Kariarchaeaceae archaeon]|jgi:hypothetical protein